MPRDSRAALAAWAKRKRASSAPAPFQLASAEHEVRVSATKDRAWASTPQAGAGGLHDAPINTLGNLTAEGHGKKKRGRAGDVSESVAIAILNDLGGYGSVKKVLTPSGGNNAPVDAVGDKHVFEIKGGSIGNDAKSRQWRITNGQTSKKEVAQFAKWRKQGPKGRAKLRAYNEQKRQDAMDRKREIAKVTGKELVTIGVVLNHAKGVADVFIFKGVEKRISWDDSRVAGAKRNGRGSAYLTSRAYSVKGLK